jgi:hypothetical protein
MKTGRDGKYWKCTETMFNTALYRLQRTHIRSANRGIEFEIAHCPLFADSPRCTHIAAEDDDPSSADIYVRRKILAHSRCTPLRAIYPVNPCCIIWSGNCERVFKGAFNIVLINRTAG